MRVYPYYVGSRCLLCDLLGDQGRFDEAIAQFSEALRINPEHENSLRSLALAKQLRAQNHPPQLLKGLRPFAEGVPTINALGRHAFQLIQPQGVTRSGACQCV